MIGTFVYMMCELERSNMQGGTVETCGDVWKHGERVETCGTCSGQWMDFLGS